MRENYEGGISGRKLYNFTNNHNHSIINSDFIVLKQIQINHKKQFIFDMTKLPLN